MQKPDLASGSLLPIILIAGLLTGSLWRSPAPEGSGKSQESQANETRVEAASPSGSWLSDLRPVMETLAAALGADSLDLDEQAMTPAVQSWLEEAEDVRNKQ